MSTIAMGLPFNSARAATASNLGSTAAEVVEVQLLLPAQWAQELMQLSRARGESVAQILRSMIGRGLQDESSSA
jgi:hypothetical protein